MRFLEMGILVIGTTCLSGSLLSTTHGIWIRLLALSSLVLTICQIVIEGHRWQIFPAYLVAVMLFVACAIQWPRQLGPLTVTLGILLLFGAGGLCTVLPVATLPRPTGSFPVGTVTRHFVDQGRKETQGPSPERCREIMVQFWYPASRSGAPSPYRMPSETTLRRDRLALIKTHSALGVPVSDARPRYPVILYSPGWQGSRHENVAQVEELASRGFVVAGIDHTYGTDRTVFPDGRVTLSNIGSFLDFSSSLTYERTLTEVCSQLQIRVADVRFVLNELDRLDADDPDRLFTGHLDLTRAGVYGYSFGGAVAMEACHAESRFRAGGALDNLLFGKSAEIGVEKPFLFLTTSQPLTSEASLQVGNDADRRRALLYWKCEQTMLRTNAEHGGYWVMVRGTEHPNFCDTPLLTPLKWRTGAGPIDATRATKLLNQCLVSFFEQTLNDGPSSTLEVTCTGTPELSFIRTDPVASQPDPSRAP